MYDYDTRPAGTAAIMALVLGILGLVLCGACTGVPAWIVGWMELRAIQSGVAPAAGKGLAQAGMILGIFTTLFTVVVGLAFMLGLLPFLLILEELFGPMN